MSKGFFDYNNTALLVRYAGETFFFIELVNRTAARQRSAAEAAGPLEARRLNAEKAILEARRQFWTRAHREPGTTIDIARRTGVLGDVDREHLDKVVERLLAPATIVHDSRSHLPSTQGRPNLPATKHSVPLSEEIWLYETPWGAGISTEPTDTNHVERLRNQYRQCHDEILDPVSSLIDVLMGVYGIPLEHVAHYTQLWLRKAFELEYTPELRYMLAGVCDTFNGRFYGAAVPTPSDLHSHRPASLSTTLFIDQLARELRDHPLPGESPSGRDHETRALAQALGLYCTFRYCRMLRNRNELLGPGRDQPQDAAPDRALVALGLDKNGWVQTTRAIRAAEYTFVLGKLFGVASGIPGLSYIFRGGILPGTDRGRTFVVTGKPGAGKSLLALQMMADAAARGRLAVYVSTEESYSLVSDRLVTFRLTNEQQFDVVHVKSDDTRELEQVLAAEPRRGILVLYSISQNHRVDVLEMLRRLAALAEERWHWRAVAIDSLEALEIGEGSDLPVRSASRGELHALLSTIEEQRFFGIIVSEAAEEHPPLLWYLADTIIQLGAEATGNNRWIEIMKARSQDYHAGRHVLRIAEGRGAVIYPSLTAIQRTMRRKVRATRSELREIPCPRVDDAPETSPISEKSRVLVLGPDEGARRHWLVELLTTPSRSTPTGTAKGVTEPADVRSVLIVLFRTTELDFNQRLRADKELNAKWSQVQKTRVRWFSPGLMSGAQLVDELRATIHESRREGLPIERVAFDEIETAQRVLPNVGQEPLFWWTIAELMGVEALTAFFGMSSEHPDEQVLSVLRSCSDRTIQLEGASGIQAPLHSARRRRPAS